MRKCISLSEEDIELLEQYKQHNSIRTDSQAFSNMLRESKHFQKNLAVTVREELESNYLNKERTKWATQTAEQNSILLLDAMNTLLHMFNAKDCISTEVAMHPVLKQSQDSMKKKIAYFKQKSDERKAKSGMTTVRGHE